MSLRDRIAQVIEAVDDWRGVTDPTILADAVIEALGLSPEQAYDPIYGRTSTRYVTDTLHVTEWETDETD